MFTPQHCKFRYEIYSIKLLIPRFRNYKQIILQILSSKKEIISMAGCSFCEKGGRCSANGKIRARVNVEVNSDGRQLKANEDRKSKIMLRGNNLSFGDSVELRRIENFGEYAQERRVELDKLLQIIRGDPSRSYKPSWLQPLKCHPFTEGYTGDELQEQQSECTHYSGKIFEGINAIRRKHTL